MGGQLLFSPSVLPLFCDTVEPPGSSIRGISQAGILEWLSALLFPSSGHLPDPGIKPVSPAMEGRFFTSEPPEKPWGRADSYPKADFTPVTSGQELL